MKQLLFFWTFLLTYQVSAITVYDTLYINKAEDTIGIFSFQVCVFNVTDTFVRENAIIELDLGDDLQLHVINNDTLDHTFTIDGMIQSNNTISPSGNMDFTLNFTAPGPYRYYSDKAYGQHLGASSIIMYGYETYPRYYWNMYEMSDTLSYEIADLQAVFAPFTYQPTIFTINMRVHPHTNDDPYAHIEQQVGDTIYLSLMNSGMMLHTIHFHGYHVEIIDASINTRINGWIKDSFSILENEIVFVRLIPDKAGLYPVHEHNLINVTTNGVYPGGMINTLTIQP